MKAKIKDIPVEWLRKKLVDLLFNDEIREDVIKVYWLLIAEWEKENELR